MSSASDPNQSILAISPRSEKTLFFSAFILWVCLKVPYFQGVWPWAGESGLLNNWAKFFLLALSYGEYPLWDPFHFWGAQEDYVALNYGQLNPFLYITLILFKLGFSFPVAFFIYTIAYYFFGLLGFYCLAKMALKDILLALWAYAIMLFSSLGIGWYMQHNIFLALAPIFWFFYFLLQLVQTQERKYIFGLTFITALIATTYVPSYFILTLTACGIGCGLFDRAGIQYAVVRVWQAIVKYKGAVAVGLLTVIICLIPRINWYAAVQDPQYIFHVRSNPSEGKHAAAVDIQAAVLGGLATEYTIPELFTDLDIGTTQFYYVSIGVYLLLLLSMGNRATALAKVLFFMFFSLFVYTLADVTPVHEKLFFFIPSAKYARNYYFMSPLLAALLTLLAMESLKQFWHRRGKGWFVYVALVHGAFLAYLLSEDFVSAASYAAVVLSFCAFLSVIFLSPKNGTPAKVFVFFLSLAALIQPLEVNFHFARRPLPLPSVLDQRRMPDFSYTRPDQDTPFLTWGFLDLVEKEMTDNSGYVGEYYFGVKWSYLLNKNVSQRTFAEYTRYKFFLFDNVVYMDQAHMDFKRIEESLSRHENLAFIHAPKMDRDIKIQDSPRIAEVIKEPSERFRVTDFKLNALRLSADIGKPKFLVYNDSYHSGWRVFVNGQPAVLYRANGAFKGVWLPAGKSVVEFRYGPVWLPWLYTGIIVYFIVFSALVLRMFIGPWRRRKGKR